MKKTIIKTFALLFLGCSAVKAQQINPCGTTEALNWCKKNIPGYKEKVEAKNAVIEAEYQTYLQNLASQRTTSVTTTFTIPVVFHILHTNGPENIPDVDCINALAQVNTDYAKLGADTSLIDPLFKSLYVDSKIHFELAKKDPYGNCTSGIVHHYDTDTEWNQTNFFGYKYSNDMPGRWRPSEYLNIYIVKNIFNPFVTNVGGGITVGYTYKPGNAPGTNCDAIVYRYDFLGGLQARALSHEIGHWLGLSHTFGDTNSPGFECGNDDVSDTPPTTGFFSTCPKPASFLVAPTVSNPIDSSDIVKVSFGVPTNVKGIMTSTTSLNSLNGTVIKPLLALIGTTVTPKGDTVNYTAAGVAGAYSDFSGVYGCDFNAGSTNTLVVTSIAKYSDNNYVGVYLDKNRNGSFLDAGENILLSTAPVFGPQTFSTSVTLPAGMYGIFRMRVITSNASITSATMTPSSGEIEDYNFNIGTTPSPTVGTNVTMATCSNTRPNIENFMDYSSCPKMFTQGQTDKMRYTAVSFTADRYKLADTTNLQFTGLWDASYNPTGPVACAPIADFYANKVSICNNQSVTFNSTSYNSTPTTYAWAFEGGNPSTSNLAAPTVTYNTPGLYSVTLTVSNANGSNTKVISPFLHNFWNSDPMTLPYTESFESPSIPNGWYANNLDYMTIEWQVANYGSQGTSKSMVLPNTAGGAHYYSNIDMLESPQYNFSNTTGISISYDYTYVKQFGSPNGEIFKFQYSTDCGGTWTDLPTTPTAAAMSTSGASVAVASPYIPQYQSQWVTKTYIPALLSALNNKPDVKFRFYFKNDPTTGLAQNLYIDEFKISGVVGINELENNIHLSLYPNPTNSTADVEFIPQSDSKVKVSVMDITGRVIEEEEIKTNSGILTKYTVNKSNKLSQGVYLISLVVDNQKVTKKLIIE